MHLSSKKKTQVFGIWPDTETVHPDALMAYRLGRSSTLPSAPRLKTLAMPYGVIVVAEKSGGKVQGV